MKYFRTPPEHRKKSRVMWWFGGLTLFFAALFTIFFLQMQAQGNSIPGSDAAARWTAADSIYPFAQISLYYDQNNAFPLNTLYRNRMELQKQMEQNAVSPANERARLFLDAFSGETTLTLTSSRSSVSVTATVCGGSFFFFHPVDLYCGSYFSEDSETINTVILDEYAAWQLFGALDVAGMEVTLNDQPFRVVGVSKTPAGTIEKNAYGAQPRIYINYAGLRMANQFDQITCYEVLLPNPIKNFAKNMITTAFGISATVRASTVVLYDSTSRFSFETLAKQVPDFFARSMRWDRVIPPWWENIARVAEAKAIVFSGAAAVCGVLTFLLLVVFLSLWFYIHPIKAKAIYLYFDNIHEKRRMKRWKKKHTADMAHL